MLRRVPLVRTDVSEEHIASIVRTKRISELGKIVFFRRELRLLGIANVVPSSPILVNPDDGGDTFLRNVASDKIHTVSHPRRWHSSFNSVPHVGPRGRVKVHRRLPSTVAVAYAGPVPRTQHSTRPTHRAGPSSRIIKA
jgi:hypothetical protein